MKRLIRLIVVSALCLGSSVAAQRSTPPDPITVSITGERRQWHKITMTVEGPTVSETSTDPNPFLDYRMTVRFVHESGAPVVLVPGYFAGDGRAGETSATSGNKWRAHFTPEKPGVWTWRIGFVSGKNIAIDPMVAGQPVTPINGQSSPATMGQQPLTIAPSDKQAPDFRALGRLQYVGERYLQFQGSRTRFLKLGSDSPETLLAYGDFDGTTPRKPQVPLHTYAPHVADWKAGDPVWQGGKGKGLIGAINYLASKGVNSMSFLTYNAGGDGDNVWPYVSRPEGPGNNDKLHFDVSKLDQWQVVFDHMQQQGIHLHFKLQETENDDQIVGNPHQAGRGARGGSTVDPQITVALDRGDLGVERKLYLRELIARFGYELALNWNLGEESTLSTPQQQAMAQYIKDTDPYVHNIVLHTHPEDAAQDEIYGPLLGSRSALTGASLQIPWDRVHQRTLRWVDASAQAGRPWVVANDEQGGANVGTPPDAGYSGFTGKDAQGRDLITLHDIRKDVLWGNLMAGGAGVEYYFGYQLPDNDLTLENFRSRDKSWDYGRIALTFFRAQNIPFWEMKNADELVGNSAHDNSRYCLAKAGEWYLVYLPTGGTATLDLAGVSGAFTVRWFDPRAGGALQTGSVATVRGGGPTALGTPPGNVTDDWVVVVRRES